MINSGSHECIYHHFGLKFMVFNFVEKNFLINVTLNFGELDQTSFVAICTKKNH